MQFSKENKCTIVAEGVETAAELKVLRALGITRAQGYFLGRPVPLAAAATLCRHSAQREDETQFFSGNSVE
jgi:EAL domain-containing protein (putative c-di-GMP-specific phosphodiesterase class I)